MPRSSHMTMAWQPTPAPTGDPAPATVDRLCGHPLQNAAVRAGAAGVMDSAVRAGAAGVMDSAVRPRGAAAAGGELVSPVSVVACGGSPARRMSGAVSRCFSRRASADRSRSALSSPSTGTSGRSCSSRLPTTRGRSRRS